MSVPEIRAEDLKRRLDAGELGQLAETAFPVLPERQQDAPLGNRQAELLFGWSRAEVLGRPVTEFLVPERYRNQFRDDLALL